MKFNRDVLFIASDINPKDVHPANTALKNLEAELLAINIQIHVARSFDDGISLLSDSPKFSSVGIYWNDGNKKIVQETIQIINIIRSRSKNLPIFLLTKDDIFAKLPIDITREIKEYIYIFSETAAFTAKRVVSAILKYNRQLLPPYFGTLKNFTEEGDYYWDCPGHMGGMAYLKHPVGVEFFNFFGENMLRADIGVATAEMGDYLIHAGPPKQSEEIAAKLFGSDWTLYTVSGSSGSNRIVAQGTIGADEIAIVDRNCHKSLNHGLTLSQARPVYLKPTRNGYGLVGPIPLKRMAKESIDKLIRASSLTKDAASSKPTYAVVTNCTYDGFTYNVSKVVDALKDSVPLIHFDEAWYAYAKFHPLYKERFAMGVSDKIKNMPTLFAVQSTHKMLPALSMASMIHIKKSSRAPVDFDDFNDSFMMHGTTSPYYPIIASIDVAVAMMEGEAGVSLVQESIEEAIAFRKAVVKTKRELKNKNSKDWFFDILQPTDIKTLKGKKYSFEDAPVSVLSSEPSVWTLKAGEEWHGFADKDIEETDCMLDPVKVSITCPGITPDGKYQEMGIPGYIITKFLNDRRTEIARTGDYTILILFSVGTTKGKWGTLIESLLEFKKLYDSDALAIEAIPSLAKSSPMYAKMTLKELCQSMHGMMRKLGLMKHLDESVNTDPEPVLSPSDAYQKVIHHRTEQVKIRDFAGRIAASMLVPYPPGIPVLMPGERIPRNDNGIIGYLEALQEFDRKFPGFEHEIQGVKIDENGDYWVRAIIEDDRQFKKAKEINFRPYEVSTSAKRGRQ